MLLKNRFYFKKGKSSFPLIPVMSVPKTTGLEKMADSLIRIFNEIVGHVDRNPEKWYVGITHDLDERNGEHEKRLGKNIPSKDFFYWDAKTKENAESIEKQILEKYKDRINGDTGGGTENSKFVYIFKIPK